MATDIGNLSRHIVILGISLLSFRDFPFFTRRMLFIFADILLNTKHL